MPENMPSRIVADGPDRVRKDYRHEIEDAVRARYADELESTRGLKRLMLRHRIRREIRDELEQAAPKRALYLSLELGNKRDDLP